MSWIVLLYCWAKWKLKLWMRFDYVQQLTTCLCKCTLTLPSKPPTVRVHVWFITGPEHIVITTGDFDNVTIFLSCCGGLSRHVIFSWRFLSTWPFADSCQYYDACKFFLNLLFWCLAQQLTTCCMCTLTLTLTLSPWPSRPNPHSTYCQRDRLPIPRFLPIRRM